MHALRTQRAGYACKLPGNCIGSLLLPCSNLIFSRFFLKLVQLPFAFTFVFRLWLRRLIQAELSRLLMCFLGVLFAFFISKVNEGSAQPEADHATRAQEEDAGSFHKNSD